MSIWEWNAKDCYRSERIRTLCEMGVVGLNCNCASTRKIEFKRFSTKNWHKTREKQRTNKTNSHCICYPASPLYDTDKNKEVRV